MGASPQRVGRRISVSRLVGRLSDRSLPRRTSEESDCPVHSVVMMGALLGTHGGMQKDLTFKGLEDDDKTKCQELLTHILGQQNEVTSSSDEMVEEDEEAEDEDEEGSQSPRLSPPTPEIKLTTEPLSGADDLAETDDVPDLPEEEVFDFGASGNYDIATGEAVEENVLDICTFSKSGDKFYMRAMLDTGAEPNVICESKAKDTGFEIEAYDGESLIVADGRTFRPIGCVKLQWHFHNRRHEKTYNVKFLVVSDDAPYDVVLGFPFIKGVRLFSWNPRALILTSKARSEKDKQEQARRKEEQRIRNEKIKEEERERQRRELERQGR